MGKQNGIKSYADWRLRENITEYNFHFTRIERLVKSMFEWDFGEDRVSQRYLETVEFDRGFCIVYRNKAGFLQCCRAAKIGLNEYNEPIGYRTITINPAISPSEYVKAKDCVVIPNDILWNSSLNAVNFFAKRLSGIENTMTLNLEHLKRPYIITCPEGMESSVESFMTQKTNGKDYILVKESFSSVNFQIMPLSIKNEVPALEQSKKLIVGDMLTYFGVNNVNILKKERLTASEGSENDEEILLSKCSMYKTRKIAQKEINEKFNVNWNVGMSTSIYSEISQIMEELDNE